MRVIGVVWSSDGSSGRFIRLRVDLPGDAVIVHLAENVVIGDGRGAAIAGALKIMRAYRQRAIGGIMAAARREPEIIHQGAGGV